MAGMLTARLARTALRTQMISHARITITASISSWTNRNNSGVRGRLQVITLLISKRARIRDHNSLTRAPMSKKGPLPMLVMGSWVKQSVVGTCVNCGELDQSGCVKEKAC
jgi:hypothetical protein